MDPRMREDDEARRHDALALGMFLLSLFFQLMLSSPAEARLIQPKDQALKEIFGDEAYTRKEVFLSDEQKSLIEEKSKSKLDSKLLVYYQSTQLQAFLDTHVVRTQPETALIVINRKGQVETIKITSFNEPLDYLPPARWLGLFRAKEFSERLWLKQDVDAIAGATFSSWALVKAVRRSLVLHEIIGDV